MGRGGVVTDKTAATPGATLCLPTEDGGGKAGRGKKREEEGERVQVRRGGKKEGREGRSVL